MEGSLWVHTYTAPGERLGRTHTHTHTPRAATSVATRIGQRPDLKFAMAKSRICWFLSPWMAAQRVPVLLRCTAAHVRNVWGEARANRTHT